MERLGTCWTSILERALITCKLSTTANYQLLQTINYCKLSTTGNYELLKTINYCKLDATHDFLAMPSNSLQHKYKNKQTFKPSFFFKSKVHTQSKLYKIPTMISYIGTRLHCWQKVTNPTFRLSD